MKVKDSSVKIDCLSIFIKEYLTELDNLVKRYTHVELDITSGCELIAIHEPGSKHYTGDAIDIRTWGIYSLKENIIEKFIKDLYKIFPDDLYDIVKEKDHIHIEFDPKLNDIKEIPIRMREHLIKVDETDGVIDIPILDHKDRITIPLYYKIAYSSDLKDAVRVGKFIVNAFGRYYTGITLFNPECKKKDSSLTKFIKALTKLVNLISERTKK